MAIIRKSINGQQKKLTYNYNQPNTEEDEYLLRSLTEFAATFAYKLCRKRALNAMRLPCYGTAQRFIALILTLLLLMQPWSRPVPEQVETLVANEMQVKTVCQ